MRVLDPPGNRQLLGRGQLHLGCRGLSQTATIAADDVSWSYTFPGANFPAEGNYTVHVVSTDNGGNAQTTRATRYFKIDRTAPISGVLALNSVNPAGSAYLSGTTCGIAASRSAAAT